MKSIFYVIVLLFLTSCGTERLIDVDLIAPTIEDIAKVHDAYVMKDTEITDIHRKIYLSNTAVLLQVIHDAQGVPSPAQ